VARRAAGQSRSGPGAGHQGRRPGFSQSLEQAKAGAHFLTQETEAVAAAAAEQLQAIEAWPRRHRAAALADKPARAVRFVRGDNGRQ